MAAAISRGHRVEQEADFLLDIGWVFHGLGDLAAEEFAVAFAHAENGHGHGAGAHAEGFGQILVGVGVGAAGEVGVQGFKELQLACFLVVAAEGVHGALEEVFRPASLEEFFRGVRVGQFALVAVLAFIGVHRDKGHAAAAFFSAVFAGFVAHEVAQSAEEEGAEAAALRVGVGEHVIL